LLEANGQEPCHPTGPFTWIGMELGNLLVGYCNQEEQEPDRTGIPPPPCIHDVAHCMRVFQFEQQVCEDRYSNPTSREREACEMAAKAKFLECIDVALD